VRNKVPHIITFLSIFIISCARGGPIETGSPVMTTEVSDLSSTSSTSSSTSTGIIYECNYNEDCSKTEICYDNSCKDTLSFNYNITVNLTYPDWCEKELYVYFEYYRTTELLNTSTFSNCPYSWINDKISYIPKTNFELVFNVKENSIDCVEQEDICTINFCWENEFYKCMPIPEEHIRSGVFEDEKIKLIFEPVEKTIDRKEW
jgi:hypothetical protein